MDKKKASYYEGTVSIFVNIGLFLIKYWVGIVSGSVALIADAWHTLSDSISSVIVIAGAKLSSKGFDEQHPFGHGRWEHLASIFIGLLLDIIAFDLLKESVLQFRTKESANFGTIALVVTITSIIIKETLSQYAFFLGRKTDNASFKADGWHHRTDAVSSLIILIGILFKDRFWWIDSALGFLVALMLFYAAYEIIKESVNKILGESPSPELINDKELSFHIRLKSSKSIEEGHLIAAAIER